MKTLINLTKILKTKFRSVNINSINKYWYKGVDLHGR